MPISIQLDPKQHHLQLSYKLTVRYHFHNAATDLSEGQP